MRLLPFALVALFGCDAIYTDLRPQAGADGGLPVLDAFTTDADLDPGADASVPDGGSPSDGGTPADAGDTSGVTLVGTFEGRGGYDAAGTATLRPSGSELELVLSDDFASAAVPGPVVVVTSRSAIGTSLTAEDTVVARLDGDSVRGGNTFAVPLAEAPSPAYAFIYCEPFGVETARAALELR